MTDFEIATKYFEDKGIVVSGVRKGNGCVWVSHGRCECYVFIKDGKVVDVIYD